MAVDDYSTTPASNTAISGIDIDEGCSPGGINNAIRQLMADIKSYVNSTAASIAALMPKSGGTFTGAIGGTAATFSGALSAASAAITGAVNAASANFTAAMTADRARLTSTGGASLVSTAHGLQIGDDSGLNTRYDARRVQAVDNGSASDYRINENGGDVRIGASGNSTLIFGDLSVSSDVDVSGALDVTDAADFSSHVDMAGATSSAFRGARGLFYYTGSSTLSFGQTTSGANIAPVSIDVAGSGGGSGGGSSSSGITTANINTGSSASGTWACAGYAVQNSITEFVRVG